MAGGQHLPDDRGEASTGKLERVGVIRYKRQEDADADDEPESDSVAAGRAFVRFVSENEPLLDAILYDWYPDRLPGELDETLDLLRFWRMIDAKSIMSAEDERQRLFDGAPQPTKKDGEKWRRYQRQMKMIAEHDALLNQFESLDAEG